MTTHGDFREKRMNRQNGFTLVELIAVIIILAILSVVAVPQFVNLRADAQNAATRGVAGALSSGSALNYAVRSLNSASGVAITNCQDARSTLQGGIPAFPSGYTVTSLAVANGVTQPNCTLNGPNGSSATFTAIGIN